MKEIFENEKNRKILIAFWITLMVAIVTFVIIFISFSNKLKSTADLGLININTTSSVVPNSDNETIVKEASSTEDKDINTVANETLSKTQGQTLSTNNVLAKEEVTENVATSEEKTSNTENTSAENTEAKLDEEIKKELQFIAPVSGEIITDYADESLIYSKTLDEWITHLGIDIKGNKASTVVASEEGTVKSIKNDPRYGLTVTVEHSDGYETVYSNLLSAEFVKEGDSLEKGQTIGTIGESASFETSDVPHLHFEIRKNGENVNPTTLFK
jgi:murein DD-endopeptidase MepM/ murein hydrolase activator NlpD